MLYIVGTPIGNMEDLSYRQAKTITSADILLTEDTRSTGFLLQRIEEIYKLKPNSNQRMISYYKEKEFQKLQLVIDFLLAEKNIALISQAGMPLISDPGYLLVKTVIRKELPFTVIPGPSAVTTSLIHSGLKTEKFMFLGFLPKKEGQIKTVLERIVETKKLFKDTAFIAFESPNRINATLELISEILPESDIIVTRELTKKFEEIARGKASELKEREYKGEITLLIS